MKQVNWALFFIVFFTLVVFHQNCSKARFTADEEATTVSPSSCGNPGEPSCPPDDCLMYKTNDSIAGVILKDQTIIQGLFLTSSVPYGQSCQMINWRCSKGKLFMNSQEGRAYDNLTFMTKSSNQRINIYQQCNPQNPPPQTCPGSAPLIESTTSTIIKSLNVSANPNYQQGQSGSPQCLCEGGLAYDPSARSGQGACIKSCPAGLKFNDRNGIYTCDGCLDLNIKPKDGYQQNIGAQGVNVQGILKGKTCFYPGIKFQPFTCVGSPVGQEDGAIELAWLGWPNQSVIDNASENVIPANDWMSAKFDFNHNGYPLKCYWWKQKTDSYVFSCGHILEDSPVACGSNNNGGTSFSGGGPSGTSF